ncbi:hypothetical protein [Streptomyces sp. NPDC056165]|uniref:hypothetical protein n=1 Tax=Streptomyces sp. NPDC056165 TaxID=3345733 RepID=UPI0035D81D5C
MASVKSTVSLSVIVKDEAPVIRRGLESVRPLNDTWVIVDTGSADATQDIIRDVCSDLSANCMNGPGRVVNCWRLTLVERVLVCMGERRGGGVRRGTAVDVRQREFWFRMRDL